MPVTLSHDSLTDGRQVYRPMSPSYQAPLTVLSTAPVTGLYADTGSTCELCPVHTPTPTRPDRLVALSRRCETVNAVGDDRPKSPILYGQCPVEYKPVDESRTLRKVNICVPGAVCGRHIAHTAVYNNSF